MNDNFVKKHNLDCHVKLFKQLFQLLFEIISDELNIVFTNLN